MTGTIEQVKRAIADELGVTIEDAALEKVSRAAITAFGFALAEHGYVVIPRELIALPDAE